MLNDRELSAAIGTTAYAPDGASIGTVEHFFVDDRTGAPTWVAVSTGLFGTRHSIVPAVDATFADGALRLPVTKDAVKSAPHVAGTQHLDPGEEAELRRHYGLTAAPTGDVAPSADQPGTEVRPEARPEARAEMAPTAAQPTGQLPSAEVAAAEAPAEPAPAATPSDGSMTRSEEQLRVHTEQVAATRVRLVKYVVTEQVQITVPIRREEIRIEEVPLDAPDLEPGESLVDESEGRHAAEARDVGAPPALPEEIVLHREEPVVSVRVVPAERVRLRTELVQGQEQVGAQLQREQIAVDEQPIVPRA